ncbi:leucyl/phenylalanyl-tRNA--protein transferase [Palleronia marisminoris]|uniref:Leucyl/phenylalanyl-tRNA--protein transferase n=1 Tax=Palleronia marisminoris TaxID=315423 RepID=A0A1Y5RIN5_9RHOB|nr:leucyl/phenylalanyl-tRNA--protein transferase [Palleronia marisminoris]SFG23028.1 leucyl/phenylalanyl-tRNA--protein transferase [Palleronia marisminoris]SLN18220.1 Leucyl/phenylalanyl-tRNA--protein transferase [Palleronia marisminoris]
MTSQRLTPELVLAAYGQGIFPMAEGRDAQDIYWLDPRQRGILPLDGFHISRSLRRRIRTEPFRITFDRDFDGVIAGCADRDETWINDEIASIYSALFAAGHAHSIELWEEAALVGGVYGVSLGGAFFGESMFSLRRDASKIALVYLCDRLRQGGYTLFDTQFITPHLATLGAVEIPRDAYHRRLDAAVRQPARFDPRAVFDSPDQVLQRITQTS